MKSPHMFVSVLTLFLIVGFANSVSMTSSQRGTPPGQARAQSVKPPKPDTPAKPSTPAVPAGKGSQTPAQHLAQQPKLAAKIQPLLPPGADVQAASAGFKNLGQFIAAAHVSKNLNIPFDQLKLRMTGANPKSLGQSIQELKPSVDADKEVKKAEAQAKKDQEGER